MRILLPTATGLLCGLTMGCPKDEPPSRAPSPSDNRAGDGVGTTPAPTPAPTSRAAATPTPSPAASAVNGDRTPPPASPATSARRKQEEDCVDRWLTGRNLDAYGHPEGTMYTGGTPLFDERTGQRYDRLDYVYRRHPEARRHCGPPGSAPPPRRDGPT